MHARHDREEDGALRLAHCEANHPHVQVDIGPLQESEVGAAQPADELDLILSDPGRHVHGAHGGGHHEHLHR